MNSIEVKIKDEILTDNCCKTAEDTKLVNNKVKSEIQRYQQKIKKHISSNFQDFLQTHTTADLFLDEGETLLQEAEDLLQSAKNVTTTTKLDADVYLNEVGETLAEAILGLKVSQRILKIDDMFECIEEAASAKEFLIVLELLNKIKSLIYCEVGTDVDRVFQQCDCYDPIKVKYHVLSNILKQSLQQRFEQLVQFTNKPFPQAKFVSIQVSKDVNQLRDIMMALFQVRYNPTKICDFLLTDCLEPIISKPVSVEYTEENPDYIQITLSYSLKDLGDLRSSYKSVFEHIRQLFNCLNGINVSINAEQHVFSIIGEHIKQKLLTLIVDKCLMNAIPETMDELRESSLIEDVLQFEHYLADLFIIGDDDSILRDFTDNFEDLFLKKFSKKVLSGANEIMQKDLQDMILIAEKNSQKDIENNPGLFPRCMISKSTVELIKLMERILSQSKESNGVQLETLLNVISVILNNYAIDIPKIHEKLLEKIPQQSALFYNNCMFLAQWLPKSFSNDIKTFPPLVNVLQTTGKKYLNLQISQQQKILLDILNDLDISDARTIGDAPVKLIRQCLRQLELLKNVWQNVLPEDTYHKVFCDLIDNFCQVIINCILKTEDLSATVANELSDLIKIILENAPKLFKNNHDILRVKSWMKLEQLKNILNASLIEITEMWCEGAGILTANYTAEEVKHLIRALFQNTDRRANALARIK